MGQRVLPAERQLAVAAVKPDHRGAPEQPPALLAGAGVGREARLQNEPGLVAAADILGAAQAPAAAGEHAIGHLRAAVAGRVFMGAVADSRIQQPVERDATGSLGERWQTARAQREQRNHSFLHWSFVSVFYWRRGERPAGSGNIERRQATSGTLRGARKNSQVSAMK
ncbi:hypothetical protein D9M72_518440 [compost metagenome]